MKRMGKLEDIVNKFEDSTRNNEELGVFIKEFGYYFIAQMEERDKVIEKLKGFLKGTSSLIKEASGISSDASLLISKIKQSNMISNRQIAEGIFWKAMKE